METENTLIIFRTENIEEIPNLDKLLASLKIVTKIQIQKRHEPAVVGTVAGPVIDVLLSDPIQALTTAAEIGAILWSIIKVAKAAKKHVHFGKDIAKRLILSKINDEINVNIESGRVWGPMEIDPIGGSLFSRFPPLIEELVPYAYLMATVFPIHRKRARTYWYILMANGDILASWATQTFLDRLPDFLKPNVHE
jgi:hypothetical protein